MNDKLCQNCMGAGWFADGLGDWLRCLECNPEPPKAKVLTFARGAKVKQGTRPDNRPEPPEAA